MKLNDIGRTSIDLAREVITSVAAFKICERQNEPVKECIQPSAAELEFKSYCKDLTRFDLNVLKNKFPDLFVEDLTEFDTSVGIKTTIVPWYIYERFNGIYRSPLKVAINKGIIGLEIGEVNEKPLLSVKEGLNKVDKSIAQQVKDLF